MKSGLVSQQHLAFVAWEYLLDTDFGSNTNGLVLEAARVALARTDFAWPVVERESLKEMLIELSEELDLNLKAYCPFRRGTAVSDVGILQMVMMIAGRAAYARKKKELAEILLAPFKTGSESRFRYSHIRIDKSTGEAMSW